MCNCLHISSVLWIDAEKCRFVDLCIEPAAGKSKNTPRVRCIYISRILSEIELIPFMDISFLKYTCKRLGFCLGKLSCWGPHAADGRAWRFGSGDPRRCSSTLRSCLAQSLEFRNHDMPATLVLRVPWWMCLKSLWDQGQWTKTHLIALHEYWMVDVASLVLLIQGKLSPWVVQNRWVFDGFCGPWWCEIWIFNRCLGMSRWDWPWDL